MKEAFTVAAVGGAATAGVVAAGVTFGAPWMLMGLASLPALWWLMRSTPPKPVIENFPAVRLLFNLDSEDKQPVRMPLWQRLLRLSAAALIVAGLAEPEFQNDQPLEGEGPVMVVVDNDWSSARNWPLRNNEMETIIASAEREGRKVVLLSTAPTEANGKILSTGPLDAAAAREVVKGLKPLPWTADRKAAAQAADTLEIDNASVIWLSNGLDDGAALELARELREKGKVKIIEDKPDAAPRLLVLPEQDGHELAVAVQRAESGSEASVQLVATDENGQVIKQIEASFAKDQTEAKAVFNLPPEVRNQVTRITIDGENSAGATVLLDERWRRRPVGLIGAGQVSGSLLNEGSYVERALSPYVDLRDGDVEALLDRKLAVMILTDAVSLNDAAKQEISTWVEGGGTLLRFAGPRLAAEPDDSLLPVELRRGERSLGSGMAGGTGRIAPFEQGSPFFGIDLPSHVRINKEVLAQPGPETEERTWARLEDGSPLVTAKQQGKGWVVLVHTTANPEWSNLPLSGLFVEMMRAVVAHSQGVVGDPGAANKPLPPIVTLDGRGNLTSPMPGTVALTPEAIKNNLISPKTPPGFYGDESGRHAHNLFNGVGALTPLPEMPEGVSESLYEDSGPSDLKGPALTGAFALLLLDLLILMGQRGQIPGINRSRNNPAPRP